MNWTVFTSIAVALISAFGGLFYRAKYKAEVGKTSADTGKISAETINTLLTGVRDATAGFNEQIKKLKAEWEAERAKWEDERDKWIAERELERAIWREKEQKWERERSELRATVQAGSEERRAIKDALAALKLQVKVFESLPDQIRHMQEQVDRWDHQGPPSKDPMPESGEE